MSDLESLLRNTTRHIDYDDSADIPSDVFDLLSGLVETVQAQAEGLQNLRELMTMRGPSESGGMSRADALKLAREHVETIATGTRGYQDGVKLHDKVQAMERFARFLMGESE